MLNGFLLERKLKEYKKVKRETRRGVESVPKRKQEREKYAEGYRERIEQFVSAVTIPLNPS